MPLPTDFFHKPGQHQNHCIQKSHSVGGFVISKISKKTNNTSNTLQTKVLHTLEENVEDNHVPFADRPQPPNTAPLRRKKKGFGYILNWLKGDPKKTQNDQEKIEQPSASRPQTNGGPMTKVNYLRNGTNLSNGLVPSRSLDSLCSVASTTSFAYVPISSYSKSGTRSGSRKIPLGPTCSKDTYKARMDFRRKKIVEDLQVSLVAKYKLQPADYSPPTLRKSNFSAISGPSLPSGPYLPVTEGGSDDGIDDEADWSDASTLSLEDPKENFSAAHDLSLRSEPVTTPAVVVVSGKKMNAIIKPKERRGENLQPLALPSPPPTRNALEDIGFKLTDDKNGKRVSRNPFECNSDDEVLDPLSDFDDKTIKNKARDFDPNFMPKKLERKKTVEREMIEETQSNAPTVAVGWEADRLAEVRPYAHIPGKRKAPEPPNPNIDLQTEKSPTSKQPSSQPDFKGLTDIVPSTSPIMIAELKPIKKLEVTVPEVKEAVHEPPASQSLDSNAFFARYEPPTVVSSPKPWYKKRPFIFDLAKNGGKAEPDTPEAMIESTSPLMAKKDVKQAKKSKTVIYNSPPVRPVSLLANISHFDRCAAEIVSQRQKDQKSHRNSNNEEFYIQNEVEESQLAIDKLMDQVEMKLDCLDAIEKHNQRWEDHMNKLEEEEKTRKSDPDSTNHRHPSPTTDIDNMVSDLNTFLTTTHREIHTPKAARKNWGPNINKKDHQDFVKTAEKMRNESQNDNKMKNFADKVTNLKENHGEVSNKLKDNKKWSCAKCTLINPGYVRICNVCGASRKDGCDEQKENVTIFDVQDPVQPENLDEEQMPQKGNVLDKVVQFTALQMFARDAEKNAASGVVKPSVVGTENKTYLGAVPKNPAFKEETDPIDDQSKKNFRSEKLEKDERSAILAQWKREHDERHRLRREFFQLSAVRHQEDVITQQKRLLEEANRKLNTNQVIIQKPESRNSDSSENKLYLSDSPGLSPTSTSAPTSVFTNTGGDIPVTKISSQTNGNLNSTSVRQSQDPQPQKLSSKNEEAFMSPLVATTTKSFAAPLKFDALKTPSYFISKTATLEKFNSPVLSSESSDDHDLSDHEKLRQKRLAFFDRNVTESANVESVQKILNPGENQRREQKSHPRHPDVEAFKTNPDFRVPSDITLKAEKEKSFRRQSQMLKDPNYDYPKYPPRPVSPNFYTSKSGNVGLVRSATSSQLLTANENAKPQKARENKFDAKMDSKAKNPTSNAKYNSSQLIFEINKLVDDEFESIMNESKIEVEKSKERHQIKFNNNLDQLKSKERAKIVSIGDDSNDYEHVYCEVNVKSKPSIESKTPQEVSYMNGENKIMPIKPLKVVSKPNLDLPVRPSRGKLLKKAVSLDAESSRTTTPSCQISDRPVRQTIQENQRLRSTSGDQNCQPDHRKSSEMIVEVKEKRLSLHQYPADNSIPDKSRRAPSLPDQQKPEIILKSVTTSHKNGITLPSHPVSIVPIEKSKPNDSLTKIQLETPVKPKQVTKSDQDQLKRLSGSFKVMDKMAQISSQKKLSLDDSSLVELNQKLKTTKEPPQAHSKLTKSEEQYIAELFNAKMRVKAESKDRKFVDERKQGAIQKKKVTQTSARPPSSFIMDDVLYTTRPLPEEDTEESHRYNPETFVAFQLIKPEEFKIDVDQIDRVKPPKSQPTYLTRDEVEKLRNKSKPSAALETKTRRQSVDRQEKVIDASEQNVVPIQHRQEKVIDTSEQNVVPIQQPTIQNQTPLGLIDRLDKAIAEGKLKEAAQLAKEVSKSDITAKLSTNQQHTQKKLSKSEDISVNMFVEDKTSHNGPIPVTVRPSMTVVDLKNLIQEKFEIPAGVQRWILHKTRADDDLATLFSYGIKKSEQKIFLYLVAQEPKEKLVETTRPSDALDPPIGGATAVFKLPFGPAVHVPPEFEGRKGRYWNYEKNRWSFCSDSSDNDQDEEDKRPDPTLVDRSVNHDPVAPEEPQAKKSVIIPCNVSARPTSLVVVKTQKVDPRDGWICPCCTLMNIPTRPGCEACTTSRPEDYVVPPPGPLDTLPRATFSSPTKPLFNFKPFKIPTTDIKKVAEKEPEPPKPTQPKADNLSPYKKLDDLDLIPNFEQFECIICYTEIQPGDGIVLRECLHSFCKDCLNGVIEHAETSTVGCPYKDENYSCDMTILEREIKALVSSEVFEKHQLKSVKEAQTQAKNSFLCKTPDCKGWCFISDNINIFKCPICLRQNCITCQALHDGLDCKQYQESLMDENQDENSKKTKEWIESLISTGDALKCPNCQVVLLKKWGCDWVRCTYCKTEICWVTRQLRWGPKGKGDTSAGCRCLADGRTKCHPLCNYCH